MLLERGCSVMIGDLSLRPEASHLLSQYPQRPNGPSALFQPTNVASWPQLNRLWFKALSSFPQIDIVVPGAGIFEPAWSSFWQAPKTDSNPETVSRDAADAEPGTYAVIDVNLTHPVRLSQLAIGYWTQQRRKGCLVHVSSIAGHAAGIGTPLYIASKHGLHGFVRCLEGMRDQLGIRCGAVAPGAVMVSLPSKLSAHANWDAADVRYSQTPMWLEDPGKQHMAEGESAELFLEPEEIARGMLELCENPEYGNGTILEVSKGATRVVPLYHAPPPNGKGVMVPGIAESAQRIWDELKSTGLKV